MSQTVDVATLATQLNADATALGLSLSASQADQLAQYLQLLHRWNRTYNLTAIRDLPGMRVQHLADSLAVVPALRARHGDGAARLLDVGSGAGLPGVVLAVLHPQWEVHCVDAVDKKVTFIRQAAAMLGCTNLVAHHARVEQLPLAPCDGVISRAFASLLDFATLSGHHLRAGGTLWAMKGRYPDDELAALAAHPAHWEVREAHTLHVPGLEAERCLLGLQPAG